jgi:hypothetical protein
MHEQPDGPHARPGSGRPGGPEDDRRPARRPVARPLPDPVAIRIGRIPDTAPRYDDEVPGPASGERGPGMALASGERGPSAVSRPRGGAGRAPGGRAGAGPGRRVAASRRSDGEQRGHGDERSGLRPLGARDGHGSRDPRADGEGRSGVEWPSRFAQVLAETLAGARPPAQMTRWTTERARSHIRDLGPLLMAGQRPVVRRVVTSRPTAGVVEMSVVLGVAGQVRALAIRLELQGSRGAAPGRPARPARWVCTTVEAA